jgi:hypothetical protein
MHGILLFWLDVTAARHTQQNPTCNACGETAKHFHHVSMACVALARRLAIKSALCLFAQLPFMGLSIVCVTRVAALVRADLQLCI